MPARSSRTAELMAVQRALESARPRSSRLFRDAFARHFVSRRWRLVVGARRVGAVRRAVEVLYDRVAGPGPRASAVARTRLIDDLVTDARSWIGQLVILGAGFDARAYRLPGLAEVTVFEVDRPVTQQAKREVLGRVLAGIVAGDPLAWHVRFVPVDFERDDLARALRAAGYRDGARSLFVWEGVTSYLTPAAVDQTLGAVRGLAAAAACWCLPTSTGPCLRAIVPGSRRLAAGSRASGAGASRGGSAWLRARLRRFWPTVALGSSAMCPPPRPASGTSSRWAVGSGDRRCIMWSRPPSWQRHELAFHGVWAPLRGRSHAAGVAGVTRYQRMLTALAHLVKKAG
jgi:methyltransferase (TIGR00027 family)